MIAMARENKERTDERKESIKYEEKNFPDLEKK